MKFRRMSELSRFILGADCAFPAEGGDRVSPRRATHFLLLRQKKVSKEKATLLGASLRFAPGNLRCSGLTGSGSNSLRCAPLKQEPALIRQPLRSSALPEGIARRDIASLGPQRPSLRLALNLAPALSSSPALTEPALKLAPGPNSVRRQHTTETIKRTSERSELVDPNPFCMRRGAERFAGSGSQLFERSEFCETPRNVSTAGCPERSAGTQTAGSPFLCLLSFGEAKESESPAGARPGPSASNGKTPSHRARQKC